MVNSTRGFYEWIAQRVTAIFIGIYTLFLFCFFIFHHPLQFTVWHELFSNRLMKIATMFVMLSIFMHAWIGLWTVFTDYIKPHAIRLLAEIVVLIALFGYVFWCIEILRGSL